MHYQALYRVWRPQSFDDLVGQDHISRTLRQAIVQDKVSHAYLFTGPRGTGKTSTAKIFSKAINCPNHHEGNPCNVCDTCRSITEGSNTDVIEMDAASHNGVEYIRDIRDAVQLVPTDATFKVYIIDEVHMLSSGAFNALLKTLEEPPENVIFILATTEVHKVPLTVMSRCQRFDFFKINRKTMFDRLSYILEQEKVTFTDDAVNAITLAAEGGMRDALSLLDQAISYSDTEVTENDVLAVTGALHQSQMLEMIAAIRDEDAVQATKLFLDVYNAGKDPKRFVDDLLYYYRDILVYQTSEQLGDALERAHLSQQFVEFAQQTDKDFCFKAIRELTRAQQDLRTTSFPKIIIETALIRLCQNNQSKKVETEIKQLMDRIFQLEEKIAKGLVTTHTESSSHQKAESKPEPRTRQNKGISQSLQNRVFGILKQAKKKHIEDVRNSWDYFVNHVKQQKPSVGALIEKSKPRAASDTGIVLSFPNQIFCDIASENPEVEQMVQQFLRDKWMNQVEVVYLFEEHWFTLRDKFLSENEPVKDDKASNNPAVEQALQVFDKDIVHIIE
ncbi:MAG: DNA polymerase III subunit gamma/tau [Bacilli bacterium]